MLQHQEQKSGWMLRKERIKRIDRRCDGDPFARTTVLYGHRIRSIRITLRSRCKCREQAKTHHWECARISIAKSRLITMSANCICGLITVCSILSTLSTMGASISRLRMRLLSCVSSCEARRKIRTSIHPFHPQHPSNLSFLMPAWSV